MDDDDKADRWLETLAGRAAPDDDDTRQAQRLRRQIDQALHAMPSRPVDEARLARLLAAADVAEAEQATGRVDVRSPTPDAPGVLVPPPSGRGERPAVAGRRAAGVSGLRYALGRWLVGPARVAFATLAGISVVLALVWHPGNENPSAESDKGRPAAGGASTPAQATGVVLTAGDPAAAAAALRDRLAALGVSGELIDLGTAVQLRASVPAAARDAVQRLLQDQSVNGTAAGTLVIEFRRTGP